MGFLDLPLSSHAVLFPHSRKVPTSQTKGLSTWRNYEILPSGGSVVNCMHPDLSTEMCTLLNSAANALPGKPHLHIRPDHFLPPEGNAHRELKVLMTISLEEES